MPPIFINGQEVVKRYVGIQEVVAAYVGSQQVFSSGFDPASLFASDEKGFVFDITDQTTLFQNSNGTTAVSANNDPFGYVADLSGNANHATQSTAGTRPLWDATNLCGKFSSSLLVTPAIDLTGTDKLTIIICARFNVASTGILLESSADFNGNDGAILINETASGEISIAGRGSVVGSRTTGAYSAPFERVISAVYDLSGAALSDEILPQINGAVPSLTNFNGPLGSGNFGNHVFNIGARSGVSYPLNGSMFRIICIGRTLTTQEYVDAKNWVGAPIGFFQ